MRKSRFKIPANIPVRRRQTTQPNQEDQIKTEKQDSFIKEESVNKLEEKTSAAEAIVGEIQVDAASDRLGQSLSSNLVVNPTTDVKWQIGSHVAATPPIAYVKDIAVSEDKPIARATFKRIRPPVSLPVKKQRRLAGSDPLTQDPAPEHSNGADELHPLEASGETTTAESVVPESRKENTSPVEDSKPVDNSVINDVRPGTPVFHLLPKSPLKSPTWSHFVRPSVTESLRRHSLHLSSASESEDDSKRAVQPSPGQRIKNSSESTSMIVPNSSSMSAAVQSGESDLDVYRLSFNTKRKKPKINQFVRKIAEARRDFNKKFEKSQPDRSSLKMIDLIYFNPPSNPLIRTSPQITSDWKTNRKKQFEDNDEQVEKKLEEENVDNPDEDDPTEGETSAPVPKVKIGANGEIILDEKSLVIETTESKKGREALMRSEPIFEDKNRKVSYYKKKSSQKGKEWSDFETKLFYKAINSVGTDFAMMQHLFPARSRAELKNKFKREERYNQPLLDQALSHPSLFNLRDLKETFDRDRTFLNEEISKKLEEKQKEIQDRKFKKLVPPKVEPKDKAEALLAEIKREVSKGKPGTKKKTKRKGGRRVFQDYVDPDELEMESEEIFYRKTEFSPLRPFDEPPPEYESSDSEEPPVPQEAPSDCSKRITDVEMLKMLQKQMEQFQQVTIRLEVPTGSQEVRVIMEDSLPKMKEPRFAGLVVDNAADRLHENQMKIENGCEPDEYRRASVIQFISGSIDHNYSLASRFQSPVEDQPCDTLNRTFQNPTIVHTFQPVLPCDSNVNGEFGLVAAKQEACAIDLSVGASTKYEAEDLREEPTTQISGDSEESVNCEKELSATDLYGGYDETGNFSDEEVEEELCEHESGFEVLEEDEICKGTEEPWAEDRLDCCIPLGSTEGLEECLAEDQEDCSMPLPSTGESEQCRAEDPVDFSIPSSSIGGVGYCVVKDTSSENRTFISNLQKGSFILLSGSNPDRPHEKKCTMYVLDEFNTASGTKGLRPLPVVVAPDLVRMINSDVKE